MKRPSLLLPVCLLLLPLCAADLAFRNISLAYGPKSILSGLSGSAKEGRLLAIMGPSGSGKTSLLNSLAGRVPEGKKKAPSLLSGERYLAGSPLLPDEALSAAYVKQEDLFFPHQTVQETLSFRVRLSHPELGPKAHADLVGGLLESMSLEGCKDTIVGDARTRGVSGGERKRLSIACQLLSAPSIILLDEPTSGLDSYQAERLVKAVKRLAEEENKIVACVIHQPSQVVFDMFDE
jgi:ABC-type multidrug transport system ATPase subunit